MDAYWSFTKGVVFFCFNYGKILLISLDNSLFLCNFALKTDTIMALEIKVIPTLTGEDAIRFINKAETVSKNRERIDFSAQIADAREILKNARL